MYSKKIKFFFDNFEEIIGGILLFVVLAMVCTEIFSRSFFGRSIVWIEEISRVLFVWAVLIGAGAGVKNNQLVSIDVIYQKASEQLRLILEILIFLVVAVGLVVLGYTGYKLMIRFMTDLLAMSAIPRGYLYASIPVGCGLMLIRLIQRYYRVFFKRKNELNLEG